MKLPQLSLVVINLCFVFFCVPLFCYSQDWDDVLMLVENNVDDEYSEDDYSFLEELYANKINLNDLTDEDCSAFIFLSEFEKASLLYYVQHNRPLFSLYELQYVLGLPIEKAKLLSLFCVVAPVSEQKSIDELIFQGNHAFAINTSCVNIHSSDYKETNNYIGGPCKEILRYRFDSFNSLLWGITLKKDMGESLSLKNGFDSQSMYMQVKNRGRLSNLVVGDYRVSIGQGLALSQGVFPGSSMEQSGGQSSAVIAKHSSTSEFCHSRGVAATVGLGNINITSFVSVRKLDGKTKDDVDFPFSISQTGYHRTLSEIDAKQRVDYMLYGVHSQFVASRFRIAGAFVQQSFGCDSVQAVVRNVSVSYNYFHRHVRMYGELALDKSFRVATIHGMQYAVSDEVLVSNSVRYFQPNYISFMSASVGRQSSVGNELGWSSNLRFVMNEHTSLYVANDLFYFPRERTAILVPTCGDVLSFKVVYKTYFGTMASYQFSQSTQTAKVEDGFDMLGKQSHKINITIPTSKRLTVKLAMFATKRNDSYGVLFYSDFVWKPLATLSLSIRLAQFDAPYDCRLYSWEDDVQYSFSNSQYFYAGTYSYVVAKWKVSKRMLFQSKLSSTRYTDKYELPDSYDLYSGGGKLQLNCLLQVSI